jgi:hypothetical protein
MKSLYDLARINRFNSMKSPRLLAKKSPCQGMLQEDTKAMQLGQNFGASSSKL